jgi:hypothetical protein
MAFQYNYVDGISFTGSATGNPGVVAVAGYGVDTNVTLSLSGKGNGAVSVSSNMQMTGTATSMSSNNQTATCAVAGSCHNNAGRFTLNASGGGVTTVVLIFNGLNNWTNNPVCFVQDESTAVIGRATTISTSAVTFTFSGNVSNGDKISYMCMGV